MSLDRGFGLGASASASASAAVASAVDNSCPMHGRVLTFTVPLKFEEAHNSP